MAEVVPTPHLQSLTQQQPSSSRKRSASADAEDSSALTTQDNTTEIQPPRDGDDAQQPPAKKTKLIRRKRRPARVQIDPSVLKSTENAPPQTGTTFNIWYNKWSGGDREDAALSQTKAISRCNIKNDAGWTQADKTPGSYFCMFFARGMCPKGHECQYLHRLPGILDVFNPNVDCFGRDKHSDYRDDMGGVGSFLRQNRTLYVGRVFVTDDIEEVVARHFQEWGEIDRIRVLTGRGVAFVTYVNEANSQFAKEAMSHQSLDHEEVLNVRWATVDPNPLSQKREAARIEEQAAEAVRRALGAKAVRQIEGRESKEERDARRIESSYGLEGYEAPEALWYKEQKEREDAEKRRLIGGTSFGERRMIEQGDGVDVELQDNGVVGAGQDIIEEDEQSQSQGLLGGSTLAALKGFAGRTTSTHVSQPARPTSTGPLVAYGSDDDDDD